MRIYELFLSNYRGIFKPVSHYNPDFLFRAIFWVAGASMTAILLLAAVTVYEITSREMRRDAMGIAVRVSQLMFEQQMENLTSVDRNGVTEVRLEQSKVTVIDSYFRKYLPNFNILKVKIYAPDKKIIFSTDPKIIGKTDSDNNRLKRALRGNTDSHIEKKDKMLDLTDETKFNVAVVETYVPIRVSNNIIGVFEIYTDVTRYTQDIARIVTNTILRLAIILLIVFGCAYLVIKNLINVLKETQQQLADKVLELEGALSAVKQLEGIIPICSWCKKIRDDGKSWHQLEEYISHHSEAKFSHGVCPECYELQLREVENM